MSINEMHHSLAQQAALQRARKTYCSECGHNDRWLTRDDPDKPGEVLGVECVCDGADYIALEDLPEES